MAFRCECAWNEWCVLHVADDIPEADLIKGAQSYLEEIRSFEARGYVVQVGRQHSPPPRWQHGSDGDPGRIQKAQRNSRCDRMRCGCRGRCM